MTELDPRRDMTGEVFGRLTVTGREGTATGKFARWACNCECGSTSVVRGDHLRSGATRSCGCLRRQKRLTLRLEGQVFGKLTVISRADVVSSGEARWHCACECGGTAIVRGTGLKDGSTRSCGCLRGWAPGRLCASCDEPADYLNYGYCLTCFRRWDKAGRPEDGPSPRSVRDKRTWLASTLATGIAAEHLVCADLLLQGYRAFMTDQSCAYDVAVDSGRLIRVQVKAVSVPRNSLYQFQVSRSGYRSYAQGEFEMLALVGLDIRVIAYILPSPGMRSVGFRVSGGSKQFADFPFPKALAELRLS